MASFQNGVWFTHQQSARCKHKDIMGRWCSSSLCHEALCWIHSVVYSPECWIWGWAGSFLTFHLSLSLLICVTWSASLKALDIAHRALQLDINLERLRMAVDVLILKLAKLFPRPKQQIVFLINNYDMTIAVLKVSQIFVQTHTASLTYQWKLVCSSTCNLNFRKLDQKVVKSKCILRNYWRATLRYSW